MKFTMMVSILFSVLVGFPAYAQFKNPKTYQECLLAATWEGMAGSEKQVKLVERSCRERFPKTAPPYELMAVKLADQYISKIEVYTKRSATKSVEAAIYNGNNDITVTQLTLLLTPETARDDMEDFFDSETYEVNLEIGPNKTASIKVEGETNIKGLFHWKILHGLGY